MVPSEVMASKGIPYRPHSFRWTADSLHEVSEDLHGRKNNIVYMMFIKDKTEQNKFLSFLFQRGLILSLGNSNAAPVPVICELSCAAPHDIDGDLGY